MKMPELMSKGNNHLLLPSSTAAANVPPPGLTVLLAEDDNDLRLLMNCILITMGYRVIACADAQLALQAFRTAPSVDLLVTDFDIPGMSGLELARKVTEGQPDLPVLLFTATILSFPVVQELVFRRWGYLRKPCAAKNLEETVRRLVNRKQAESGPGSQVDHL